MSSYCSNKKHNRKNGKMPLQAHTHFKQSLKLQMGNKRMCRTHLSENNSGSATVEATLILPIFIFAMLFIYHLGGVLCTKAVVYEAMQETAAYLAEYTYFYNKTSDIAEAEYRDRFIGTAVNTATATGKLSDYIDDMDLVDTYVTGGADGIIFVKTELDSSNNYIYMELVYQVQVNVPFLGTFPTTIKEQIRQRAYLGKCMTPESIEDEYVYIAENQSVYHTTRKCYHISLAVKTVNASNLSARYENLSPCELCVKNGVVKSILYVTDEGERYHYSRLCRGLKRTVYRVKKSDYQYLPACSYCGN